MYFKEKTGMITDAMSFGKVLRMRRKKLGYTQAFVSEFCGLSVSFISDLENGKETASAACPVTRLKKNDGSRMLAA